MNVLSLFDGCSCGQVALKRAGIKYDNYYASEIDKHAIKITQKNYPDTIQLGNVENWKDWDLNNDLHKVDLLIGGSPCQGFSNLGSMLNFDDDRSKLFFHYVNILNKYKPKYFLLENVKMKGEWRDIITSHLNVEPIMIDSSLVSGQSRNRYYWTNIPIHAPLNDKKIKLPDIIQPNVCEKYFMNDNWLRWWNKNKEKQIKKRYSAMDANNAICLTARQYTSWNGNFITDTGRIRRLTPIECERLQTLPDDYTNGISDTQRYKMLGNGWTVDVIAHILRGMKK